MCGIAGIAGEEEQIAKKLISKEVDAYDTVSDSPRE